MANQMSPANTRRAKDALLALAHFADSPSGESWQGFRGEAKTRLIQQNMADLLANLMHYCEMYGVDFEDRLRVARDHFGFEGEAKPVDCPNCRGYGNVTKRDFGGKYISICGTCKGSGVKRG